ncbi:hypothetical protein JXQ70_19270 [bacterium]|nr:hypothetical protein [bacterium]
MVQINEFINLIADLISIPLILFVFLNRNLPRYYFFLFSIMSIILSHSFTIIEDFCFQYVFNLLEHLTMLLSSLFFLTGIIKYFLIEQDHERI